MIKSMFQSGKGIRGGMGIGVGKDDWEDDGSGKVSGFGEHDFGRSGVGVMCDGVESSE